jgi:hypothetical protein
MSRVSVFPMTTFGVGMLEIVGGETVLTWTVKVVEAVSGGELLSATVTVNVYGPVAWFDAVGQVRMPVLGSICAPEGAPAPRL